MDSKLNPVKDDHPYFKRKYAKIYDEESRRKQERMFLPSSRQSNKQAKKEFEGEI